MDSQSDFLGLNHEFEVRPNVPPLWASVSSSVRWNTSTHLPHSTLNRVGCVRSSWRSIVVIGFLKILMFADKWKRNKLMHLGTGTSWLLTKMQRPHNRERMVPSINGVGKSGDPQSEEWTGPLSHTIYKNQLEMESRLNVGPENVKLLKRKQL